MSGSEPGVPANSPMRGVLAQAATRFRSSAFTQRLLPASLLNFIAGLLAGAGINLLTSLESGPTSVSARGIVVDSLIWIVAAIFVAAAARVAEAAEQRADLSMSKNFTPELNREIRREIAAEISLRFWLLTLISVAFVAVAFIRIP